MNRIKSIFTPAFFVRVVVIVLIILLAVFLYHYGKQHTVYVDNRMIKIGDESYRPLSRAEVSIDGMESQTYRQRTRREETVVRQKHTIRIESGDEVYEGEFTLPVSQDAVVLSLPAFVAGLGQDQYLSEFVPMAQQLGIGGGNTEESTEDVTTAGDDMFGDMTMDI